ncbi:hypothetical protein QQX98_001276 [Neonectria punicea]|uniref:Protein kinase domain-containing protein n=1 Tax=Neonectria punicea TaxID=979145 RepID=A0ABR1HR10_9HYPO
MEPSIRLVERIMYPIATFASAERPSGTGTDTFKDDTESWRRSMLNPQNRPDSLTSAKDGLWRMDGCQTDGHRLFITPRFALNNPPRRVDLYLSDEDEYRLPESLRRVLEPNLSMTVRSKDAWRVPLSQHILRGLERWSQAERHFQRDYMALPFGSYIAVETIPADQNSIRMHLVPQYETEHQWLSVQELAELWLRPGASIVHWPEVIGLEELQLIAQPHEAISIVRIPKKTQGDTSTLFAFKSVLDDLCYMYHELWQLLTIEPHPSLVTRPRFIVTARSRFGAKMGVCGFVLEYHSNGTMRDLLVQSRTTRRVDSDGISLPRLNLKEKFRMAREITTALLHLQDQGTFYSGIKYTNVVMRKRWTGQDDKNEPRTADFSDLSPVLIDFDHRGGRYVWTPPEIHHVTHVEYLANASEHGHMYVPEHIRARAADLMRIHYSSWQSEGVPKKLGYRSYWEHGEPVSGFSAPWLALSSEERDRAQVYMLGQLLWHLFEEVGAIDHCLHIEVFREAGDLDCTRPVFPKFSEELDRDGHALTPEPIRQLIHICTAGAPEWQGKGPPLVYRDGRLWAGDQGEAQPSGADRHAQETMRSWWIDELHEAERFILARRQHKAISALKSTPHKSTPQHLLAEMRSRPLLKQVKELLESNEEVLLSS